MAADQRRRLDDRCQPRALGPAAPRLEVRLHGSEWLVPEGHEGELRPIDASSANLTYRLGALVSPLQCQVIGQALRRREHLDRDIDGRPAGVGGEDAVRGEDERRGDDQGIG